MENITPNTRQDALWPKKKTPLYLRFTSERELAARSYTRR